MIEKRKNLIKFIGAIFFEDLIRIKRVSGTYGKAKHNQNTAQQKSF
ncbi:MAG: hypothetical protein WCK85_02415 [Chlorobium sp.]